MEIILKIIGSALIIEAIVMAYFLYGEIVVRGEIIKDPSVSKIIVYSIGILLGLIMGIFLLFRANKCKTKFKM